VTDSDGKMRISLKRGRAGVQHRISDVELNS
jgi:hypothetical protein